MSREAVHVAVQLVNPPICTLGIPVELLSQSRGGGLDQQALPDCCTFYRQESMMFYQLPIQEVLAEEQSQRGPS